MGGWRKDEILCMLKKGEIKLNDGKKERQGERGDFDFGELNN